MPSLPSPQTLTRKHFLELVKVGEDGWWGLANLKGISVI